MRIGAKKIIMFCTGVAHLYLTCLCFIHLEAIHKPSNIENWKLAWKIVTFPVIWIIKDGEPILLFTANSVAWAMTAGLLWTLFQRFIFKLRSPSGGETPPGQAG